MTKFWLVLLRFYQKFLSPDKGLPARLGLGRVCRFEPTCSQYAYDALVKYGALTGGKMAVKRLLSCHPLNAGGYQPVK